jgi:hypothetical protein
MVLSKQSANTATFALESQGSWNATVAATAAGDMIFSNPAATERMRFVAGGNLGIGTNAPTSLLHVQNSNNAIINLPSGTWASKIVQAQDASTYNGLVVGNRWAADESTAFEAGSVYGGGSAWASYYKITGLGTHTWGGSSTGTEYMRLTSSGFVGIGTSSPSNTLSVTGTFNATGASTLGGALTYGGVTLSNAVTGTGNMVLSASPTLTGTATFSHITATGTGNDFNTGGVELVGNGATNTVYPTLGFHQPGLYASSIQLRAAADFRFYAQGAGSYAGITAGVCTFSTINVAGSSSPLAALLTNITEPATISATAATGTIAFYPSTQSVLYYTSNASANWTTNITFSSGTTMNTAMTTGQSITVAFLVTQGTTAYYNSVVQVDGSTVTPKWQGGAAPTAGNVSSVDIYTYTVFKTGNAAFTVFASVTQFK